MNISKPKKKEVINTAVQFGSMTGGVMLSRGLSDEHLPKTKTTRVAVKGGIAVVALTASMFLPSQKNLGANAIKGVLQGVAVEKGLSAITDWTTGSVVDQPTDSKVMKYTQKALGLNGTSCGCGTGSYNRKVEIPAAQMNYTSSFGKSTIDMEERGGTYTAKDPLRYV